MLKFKYILTSENFDSSEVRDFLDLQMRPDLMEGRGSTSVKGKSLTEDESQKYWADDFEKHLPRIKRQRLRYICKASGEYWNLNFSGRVCQKYVWPAFFESFPKGQILLLKLNDAWLNSVWTRQFNHSADINFEKDNPFFLSPQEMSGVQADLFPNNALLIASYGFYPFILSDFTHISGNIILIYIPSVAFRHSQMTEGGAYEHILWKLHHILDDQWTFDGSRGPKSRMFTRKFNPISNVEFIKWVVNNINDRMKDMVQISDHIRCEQIAMTFSRAACDSVLSVSTQLPYMSKAFFFACLDKLANLFTTIDPSVAETAVWNQLIDKSFLNGELKDFLNNVPNPAGEELLRIVSWISDELEFSKLTPTVLRDFRNTIHGYGLRTEIVERLYRHTGELNNDITLLSTPLTLFCLAKRWV